MNRRDFLKIAGVAPLTALLPVPCHRFQAKIPPQIPNEDFFAQLHRVEQSLEGMVGDGRVVILCSPELHIQLTEMAYRCTRTTDLSLFMGYPIVTSAFLPYVDSERKKVHAIAFVQSPYRSEWDNWDGVFVR